MNQVMLKGRLVNNVDLRVTTTGKNVVNFTLAVNEYNQRDGKGKTAFVRCVAWGHWATLASEILSKGDPCVVEGKLQTSSYLRDGHRVYVTEVLVKTIAKELQTQKDEEVASYFDYNDTVFE